MLSPNDADKRLRASGGEEEAQMHCCDGTLDTGAVVRLREMVVSNVVMPLMCWRWHLQARLLLVRAVMNCSAAAAVGEGAEEEEDTATASSSSINSRGGARNRWAVRIGAQQRSLASLRGGVRERL